jgi:hypothetical protein
VSHFGGRFLALPAKIRPEWKYFAIQNTLAYYIYDKGFIGQPSWCDFLRSNGGCLDKLIGWVSLEICGRNLFNKPNKNKDKSADEINWQSQRFKYST